MSTQQYQDTDLVYVDPETKEVVGKVEWKGEQPLPRQREEKEEEKPGRRRRKRFYPFGTYRAMKKVFRLEGKKKEAENSYISFEEAVEKLSQEPFWD